MKDKNGKVAGRAVKYGMESFLEQCVSIYEEVAGKPAGPNPAWTPFVNEETIPIESRRVTAEAGHARCPSCGDQVCLDEMEDLRTEDLKSGGSPRGTKKKAKNDGITTCGGGSVGREGEGNTADDTEEEMPGEGRGVLATWRESHGLTS